MKITYYGHSCFGIEVDGKHLLFDPFISQNEKASHIDINAIPADYILLSHGHFDHVADVEAIAKRTNAKVVGSFEVVNWFAEKGLENNHPMNPGGNWKFDFGTVKCTAAIHSSSMPDGSYGGNPMGFHITTNRDNFYYAGDTALTLDMKLIGDYLKTDFALLPIGDNFTMGVDDAVIASDFIQCDNIIGLHYDTFGFIVVDHDEAKKKFSEKGKELTLMEIGESVER